MNRPLNGQIKDVNDVAYWNREFTDRIPEYACSR